MRPAQLCLTVTGPTMADLLAQRDRADADLVELRLDTVDRPDVAAALAGRRRPVIVTCRSRQEGGHFAGSEEERLGILQDAHDRGADFVDVEWSARAESLLARSGGRRVVVSMHDFCGVPADLPDRVHAMRATGAEVVKIAVTARRLTDCLSLLPFTRDSAAPTVALAMGEPGVATRILASRFGSCWTYAGGGVAPGQLPADRMRHEFGYRQIGRSTAIYGLLGRPVAHSVSPAMHNAAFRANGVDAVYLPFEAETFADFEAFADALGVAGASVTAPFKVDAFDRADESDAVSRRIRAVNTLKRDGSRWLGCNTDVAGFLAPLATAMPLQGARATVLGAGGAARSVAVALSSAGATVSVAARRTAAATEVCALTNAAPAAWPPERGSWDLLVNATSVGTFPRGDDSPMPPDDLTGGLVYDLVYNPPETRLLRDAASRGCRTIGGLDMLVAQAQAQFTWWTAIRPAERVLRQAALARLDQINARL